jgi:hypothetical protein
VNLQNEQMSIMHHVWLPYQPPRNIIQHSSWADWTLHPTKLESINSLLKSKTNSRGGGRTLNLPLRTGFGPGAELSGLNSQRPNVGKATKAESRSWVKSQPPRRAELVPSRGWARHKVWKQGWDNKPTSQSRASGGSWRWSHGREGSTQNWIAPQCWGRSQPNRIAAVG